MAFSPRRSRLYLRTFVKHDLKASVTVFFVALPLCLGTALASNAPVYSGLIAGIVGGLVVTLISRSPLSVSGPAAGLTAISAAAIAQLGVEAFFVAVALAGVLQVLLGVFRLGGFTHFIPSAVIKGMLAAIGIILISKQVPLLLGYDQPDFWRNEFFNIITLDHAFSHMKSLYYHSSAGAVVIALICALFLVGWKRFFARRLRFVPASFLTVALGSGLALAFESFIPILRLEPSQYVTVPSDVLAQLQLPDVSVILNNVQVWTFALLIGLVASLESLLSIEAIDKLDPFNRLTPRNRELVAQGAGNLVSGLVGGLPITSVIVRSSANAEAGARTRLSSFTHGALLLVAVLLAIPLINHLPYCVLAAILIRTGYNLAKPRMILAVYRQGREQFLPFIVTIIAILLTDLLIGVVIGIGYAIYFLIKHTYRAGFTVTDRMDGNTKHITLRLAMNVSFLNKKRFLDVLDEVPDYSIVEVVGTNSVYIDRDVLEIFQDFKSKARLKHVQLILKDVPEVETIELH